MSRTPAQCGTPSGYQRHRRIGETPCLECTVAASDYRRQRRAADPTPGRRRARAQGRALMRLARMHPGEYVALYAEEKAAEGLT